MPNPDIILDMPNLGTATSATHAALLPAGWGNGLRHRDHAVLLTTNSGWHLVAVRDSVVVSPPNYPQRSKWPLASMLWMLKDDPPPSAGGFLG